ncbi:unnamed protein product, partial [Closterium sp. NIES-54]
MVEGVGALVAAVEAAVGVAAVAAVGLVAMGLELGVLVLEVASVSRSSVRARPSRPSSFVSDFYVGRLGVVARMSFAQVFVLDARNHFDLHQSLVLEAIFDLDFDAILSAMYALSVSAEGDCYRCVPPDPGIAAAALGASESGTLPSMLDSGASACFFRDSTTLTPLSTPVPVQLADPSGGPVVARSSTVLLCPAVPSGSLSGLHLPSFSTNLVSTAALQDAMVTTTAPEGQRVLICTCTWTGRHLATFTRRPGSILYTLAKVAASAQVSASSQVAASCSCRLLSHQNSLWHHRLGHPSLPRLRGMHSCLLVSCLPRFLPPLPPCAAPHSSSFPLTSAPLHTLHMDVWGPARVSGQSREHYFLLVVDDCTWYTTVFPLRSKGQVIDGLIPWICLVRLQLYERFSQDLHVLRLHSDRGGEFSSNLLQDFCRGEGILQSHGGHSYLHDPCGCSQFSVAVGSPVRCALAQPLAPCLLAGDLAHTALDGGGWRCVGVPGLGLSCLCWRYVRGQALPPAIPCVFLGFVPDAPGWQFYQPTLRRVFPSQDVMFDESVPFYLLFPFRSAPPPPLPLFLAPGPPPIDPLPPQGPAPSGVSRVDPLPGPAPVQVAVGSGTARDAASGGVASGGAEPGGAKSEGAETGGAEPGGVETGGGEPWGAVREGVEPSGAASEGAESGGAEPQGAALSGGSAGASPRLSPQQLREWFVWRARLRSGATGAGGAGGAGVAAGAGVTGGTATPGPGGALTRVLEAVFDLEFDAILSAMYALSVSAEGDCYRCVPPDPGIAATALGASESSTLPSMLDSGASA